MKYQKPNPESSDPEERELALLMSRFQDPEDKLFVPGFPEWIRQHCEEE